MKKIVTILVLAFVVSTASVFALGIGVQGGYTAGGVDGALSIKPNGSNLIYAVNGSIKSNFTIVGLTADDWIANKTLAKPLNYYYGIGGAVSASIYNSGISAGVYARLLAGLNCYLLDNFFEVYLQAAWQPGIDINIGSDDLINPVLASFPVNLGFRIWL